MIELPSLYRYRWRWPIGTTLLIYIVVMYGIPGHWPFFKPVPVPATAIDRAVAFDPAWVWIYASYYFMLIAAFFTVQNDRDADNYIWDLVVCAIIGTLCFFAYPTEISRSPYPMFQPYGLSEYLLSIIRTADRDVNCAPSMHVAMSTVAAYAFARVSKRGASLGLIWTLLIVYSTLATKQHYSIDVVTGFVVGVVSIAIVKRFRISSNAMSFASV